MEPGAPQPYRLDAMPAARRQLRELSINAIESGFAKLLTGALQEMMQKLQTDPINWGDPEYHPKKQGSCVYHRACDPLFVKYVVYEPERVVLVLEVRRLPKSPSA
jgi:hypothetical protein